jgi:hypothetical protein
MEGRKTVFGKGIAPAIKIGRTGSSAHTHSVEKIIQRDRFEPVL